jgi:hypothetical protein
LAPSTRTRSESPASSTDMPSGFSSGSDGTPEKLSRSGRVYRHSGD